MTQISQMDADERGRAIDAIAAAPTSFLGALGADIIDLLAAASPGLIADHQ